ncbi:unnamed protein product [Rotaria magnacalcarata]
MKDIKDKIKKQLTNYCRREPPKAMMIKYSELLENRLRQRFMTPISFADHIRAQREFTLVKSIRRKLLSKQLILRVCDKSGGLHIGAKSNYETKAAQYHEDTKAYVELTCNPLMEIFTNVTNALNALKNSKQLSVKEYNRMMPKVDSVKLSYMYFNPKPHKEGTPVRPIMNTIAAVTREISTFLDESIRPIYDEHNRVNTFVDGVNLISRLQTYAAHGHLKSSTFFCAFDINNLYTMLPQDESIRILGDFIRRYVGERVKYVSVTTIQKLAEIVLKENVFVHNNKFYRQIVGGAMGSPFTLTLANIFMWDWEKRWIRRQNSKNEIYGRYVTRVQIDFHLYIYSIHLLIDILMMSFFTSNESIEIVEQLLQDANTWHPNIKLEYNIGSSVPFLDVLVSNQQGHLHTCVYHKPSAEPDVVPFISDHPRYTFPNIIQTALVRAIRYSSTFEAFNNERRTIRLMLLYNGYPSAYIDKQFRNIFNNYLSPYTILPFLKNEEDFFRLRDEYMKKPTPQHSQVEARIAQFNEPTEEPPIETTTPMIPMIKAKSKKSKLQDAIIIHYTHEQRFATMKKDNHEIFRGAFKCLGIEALRLIVGHRNSPNSARELIRKRPNRKHLLVKYQKKKLKIRISR